MKWILQCLVLLCFGDVALSHFQIPGVPIVVLPEYTAYGIKNVTRKGTEAFLYLGLPYVKPPVRFEKPEPLTITPLSFLKPKNATQWKPACHQVVDVYPSAITSEDCLYLNIFTPTKVGLKNLPVFVFIHGGGYSYGYTEAYGYEYFVDNFISQNIIMVTLQYRLAHFGFFATRDHVINGNFAHFDQLEALKYIKRNIKAFGGDPNKITLSGHSAGSTSTHALSLSPKTKDLYNQEIHIAGSNYALWGIASEMVFNHSELIGTQVGCAQANTLERKKCLQKVDHKKFWAARVELGLPDFVPDKFDMLYWTSNFDSDFFGGKTLDELQAAAPKRRAMYGVDFGEGLLESIITENPITNVFSKSRGAYSYENRTLANAEKIRGVLLQMLTDPKFNSTTQNVIVDRIFAYYNIGIGANATDPLHYWYKLTEIYSDIILKTPLGMEVDAKQQLGWTDQYFFEFDYVRPQDRGLIGNLPGHGYFLLYFCGLNIYTTNGISNTTEDNLVQNNLAPTFYSFIKGGEPSSNGVQIPKVNATQTPYLLIGTDVTVGYTDIKNKVDFWKQLAADYHYDFLRQVNRP